MAEYERNFDREFWDIAENVASEDIWLQGIIEYLIIGKTELVSLECLDEIDVSDLEEYLEHKYGLDPERLERSISLCERRVFEKWAADGLGVASEQA